MSSYFCELFNRLEVGQAYSVQDVDASLKGPNLWGLICMLGFCVLPSWN